MKLYKVTVYDEYTAEEYSKINKVIKNVKKYLGTDISADQVKVPNYCYEAEPIDYKGFKITPMVDVWGIEYRPLIFESNGEYEGYRYAGFTLEDAKKEIDDKIDAINRGKIEQDKIIENARKYCKIDISKDYLQQGFSDYYRLKLLKYKDYLITATIYSDTIRFHVETPDNSNYDSKYSLDTNKDNVNVYNTIINKIKQEIDQEAEARKQGIGHYELEREKKRKSKQIPYIDPDTLSDEELSSDDGYVGGYSGYSMSNSAVSAYEGGEMPMSKWTKKAIIEGIKEATDELDEIIPNLQKLTLNQLKNLCLKYKGYHHTGWYMNKPNKTDFYGLKSPREIYEGLIYL